MSNVTFQTNDFSKSLNSDQFEKFNKCDKNC